MDKEPEPAAAGALPTVSVVIPCYNYGRYLRECVSSALSQDGVEVRVLVIDDASTDDSFQVAAQLAAEDRRVSARRHEINRGHIATYNEGLVWAEGAYTVLISADDLLAPGSLGRATALMEAHPNVGFVYGGNVRFRSDEQLSGSWRFPHPPSVEIHPGREWLAATCNAGRNPISAPEVVVRTELQQRLGGYCAELPHAGDLEMWMRFAAHADVGLFRNVLHAYVRDHDSNMQRTRFASQLSRLTQRQAAFDHAFSRYGDRIDPTGRLRRVADRNVRADAPLPVPAGVPGSTARRAAAPRPRRRRRGPRARGPARPARPACRRRVAGVAVAPPAGRPQGPAGPGRARTAGALRRRHRGPAAPQRVGQAAGRGRDGGVRVEVRQLLVGAYRGPA